MLYIKGIKPFKKIRKRRKTMREWSRTQRLEELMNDTALKGGFSVNTKMYKGEIVKYLKQGFLVETFDEIKRGFYRVKISWQIDKALTQEECAYVCKNQGNMPETKSLVEILYLQTLRNSKK